MSEVNINYKGATIAGMDTSGIKTLLTEGKYCEDDIEVVYARPTIQIATGTFTGNGSQQISIPCDFEPDLVYWYGDPGTTASSGTVSGLISRGMLAANRYRNNSTSNSANIQTPITNMNTGGSSYNFRATYASGNVTLYSFSTAARNLFTSGRVYNYTFIKWTT